MSVYKLAVVGSGGVGKSTITIKFLFNKFEEEYDPTIEDSYRKQITIDEHNVLLDILDTAGQEEFDAMRAYYIDDYDAFLLAYSVIHQQSFRDIKTLVQFIEKLKEGKKCSYVLVGNKVDLVDQRDVPKVDGQTLADSLHCDFFETSAKTGENIQQAFESLVREMMKMRPVPQENKTKRRCNLY
eukprot:TRINITY_DN1341_c0_g1_i1.p1 TRINITY_DN1341_c0_g1~~TRINITY_DN1341_c0_g1_i1.p1  ORF type:complete len:184 (-),score=38.87 TRINITY_DN1341_c0_g1_i1:36-587(-)